MVFRPVIHLVLSELENHAAKGPAEEALLDFAWSTCSCTPLTCHVLLHVPRRTEDIKDHLHDVASWTALMRMRQAGAVLTNTNTVVAELVQDWSASAGSELVKLLVGPAPRMPPANQELYDANKRTGNSYISQ